jgi:uncharacterized protein
MNTRETNRIVDEFGFIDIEDNPISKVGVFPYLGKQLGIEGFEPNKIYKVYRSAKVLSDPECIESFKLIPIIIDHEMLGNLPDLTPAEDKGFEGTTGEKVYFDGKYLKSNFKLFTKRIQNISKYYKNDVSMGYKAKYTIKSGIFEGIPYDLEQTQIRGNHVAFVETGRSGSDVHVLDSNDGIFTYDSMRDIMENEKIDLNTKTEDESLNSSDERLSRVEKMLEGIKSLLEKLGGMEQKEAEIADSDSSEKYEETETKEKKVEDGIKELTQEDINKAVKTMDSRPVFDSEKYEKQFLKNAAEKEKLVEQLKTHVGVFDHHMMTLKEVVDYGFKKLNLNGTPESKKHVLNGWLQGAKKSEASVFTQDSAIEKTSDFVTNYLRGK